MYYPYVSYVPYTEDCTNCGETRASAAPMGSMMPMAPMAHMAPMSPYVTSPAYPVEGYQMPAGMTGTTPGVPPVTAAGPVTGAGDEASYIENILRFNRGKVATFYFTYQNNEEWNARIYRGRIETAGRDHIIISDPQSGKRYLLLMVNLDWVEFDGPVAYIPPTQPSPQQLTTTE